MSISQLFEELQALNLDYKLITPQYITATYFDAMVAILNFFSIHNFSEGITEIIGLLILTGGGRPLVGPEGPPALCQS